MSKEIDSLVIVGHAHWLAQQPSQQARREIGRELWIINSGDIAWADNTPITQEDRLNVLSAEVFLSLGFLATDCLLGFGPDPTLRVNPIRTKAVEAIGQIPPFNSSEKMNRKMEIVYPSLRIGEHDLPEMFDEPLSSVSSLVGELRQKWGIAQTIHARRGTASINGTDVPYYDALGPKNGIKILRSAFEDLRQVSQSICSL